MPDSLKGTLETIFVVHDNAFVRNSVVAILENANFKVLSAGSAPSAIELAACAQGRIDLLLCAVDMPQMSGPNLGEALKKTRPDLHVMHILGGKNGNLVVLNYGWAFLEQRIAGVKLIEMVTDVLHSPNRSQLGGHEFDSRKDIKNPNYG
jgi:DNA-binding NtrC family response regulator